MKILKIALTLFLLNSINLFGQPEGLTSEKIKENNITKVVAYLDMESDDPQFENLEVRFFDFDNESRCIRKKFIYPFYDVVTTSNEYIETYNENGKLTDRISIYRNEPLTKKDKEFIGLFGETNDTTIFKFKYDNAGKILSEVEFKVGSNDTLITEFRYRDSLKTNQIHYSTKSKGELNSNNYEIEFSYDDLGRISKEKKTPKTINQHSITSYKYLGETDKLIEKKTSYDFKWLRIFRGGERSLEVSQDSINSELTIYEYDENQNLLKRTSYRSYPEMETNFHGREYKYTDKLLIEEQTFNKSEEVINLTDKIQYQYDSRGMLIEERMIYREELKYRYRFKYE